MPKIKLFNNDALAALKKLPEKSIDLIFADPPYNLSGKTYQTVKSGKPAVGNKGGWDQIEDFHEFNRLWIIECKRVLKDLGTLWISGTLHNHPIVGTSLKEAGFWVLNDVIWYKPNATPLLQKNRFVPSTELIWVAAKTKKYYFNYEAAKQFNNGKQMRNLWELSAERHKTGHPTEKPERLLERIIIIGSQEGDLVLDPFMGSGTTGVVAKRFNRDFVGIEIDGSYFQMAKERIESTFVDSSLLKSVDIDPRAENVTHKQERFTSL